jgi:thiopurine S-methyltransferase
MSKYNQAYWDERYKKEATPWDIGYAATPLSNYFDQLTNKHIKLLIPGCGNAYEAEYLVKHGFTQVHVIDISAAAIENMRKRKIGLSESQLIHGDFFQHQGNYKLIIEQTFFCALDPAERPAYAKKMSKLLQPGGKLVGLLFDDALNTDHPPFGGSKAEYLSYFTPYFHIRCMETAYNSIKQRANRELFMILEKK